MVARVVTSADVARKVGVSRSTVSRAFNPDAYINSDLRAEILKVSRSLGYAPNVLAQALISRRSPIVGIVMHSLANPFHAEIYSGLTRRMQEVGLTPLTAQLSESDGVERALAVFRQYQVRQVVLTSFAITEAVLEACLASGLQVILLNRVDEQARTSAVTADLAHGGRLAARHLAERGIDRVAIVDGMPGSWTGQTRADGYLQGLQAAGLTLHARLPGDYSYEAGARAAETLLGQGALPGGVLCANDLMAFGLIDGLRAAGADLPAIVGFDDVPMAAWGAYELTSVRLPVAAMIDRLIDLLGRQSGVETPQAEVTYLPCDLVVRGTA